MRIPSFGPQTKLTVGLLGGSFNPAHEGHVYISETALKLLGLDQVWWLVSPQNPLKSKKGMASIENRVKSAQKVVRNPRIQITTLETRLNTRYTADTLKALKRRYPHIRFVWIMGADNLATFHRWKDWQAIFKTCPIAVFHRPTYALKAISSMTAKCFASYRLPQKQASVLKCKDTPAWVFLPIRGMAISATQIRQQMKD
ncbi:putative nicotinate-nucleotide adenylyltransferase [Candidatus Terasakiella magnetica]|uniref:Probable nicotinate-nucleotide adenylyltransferase n=1 Tax=Candidatus Terasakiella magnetica TaxID=1867952 RepID=A0A1C3REG3_9PROT|nr:nicotinate-nucleotide adenylyltransferase [Candidatus Terasakiella magnetica]SCA55677.1 putative nicotinate-nucleotide adenylyltransferase [Candidatus Terasakiella magnetica]